MKDPGRLEPTLQRELSIVWPLSRAWKSCVASPSSSPRLPSSCRPGTGSIANALEAVRFGAPHYLTKPAEVDEILAGFTRDAEVRLRRPTPPRHPSLARVEWERSKRVLADGGSNVS
jgi:DNA-binding NtrC family response regulator